MTLQDVPSAVYPELDLQVLYRDPLSTMDWYVHCSTTCWWHNAVDLQTCVLRC